MYVYIYIIYNTLPGAILMIIVIQSLHFESFWHLESACPNMATSGFHMENVTRSNGLGCSAQVNSIAHGELRDDDAPWCSGHVPCSNSLIQDDSSLSLMASQWSFSPRFIRLIRLRTDMAHVWASPFPCCLWVKVGMTTIICSPGTMQLLLLSCRRAKKGYRVLGPACWARNLRHRCCHTYNIHQYSRYCNSLYMHTHMYI